MKYIFLLLFPAIFITSCDKNNDNIESLNKDDFSMTQNSYWEYEVTDNLSHSTDTMRATVTNLNVSVGNYFGLVQITWSNSDVQYVRLDDTLFSFYTYNPIIEKLVPDIEFNLPLSVGDNWISAFQTGSYEVLADSVDSSNFGSNYGLSFYIKRTAFGDMGYELRENIYIAKGAGVIFRQISENQGIPTRNQMVRLLNYHIY